MAKPYDATVKDLVALRPADWLRLAGLEAEEAELINADVSTVTAEADTILRVRAPSEYVANLEMQSTYKPELPERALLYHTVEHRRLKLPMRTVVFLLRRDADGPAMSGRLQHFDPDGSVNLDFLFYVVRVWELPVEAVLAGGLATLPLAPLADMGQLEPGTVVARVDSRLTREAVPEQVATLETAMYILMGLKYSAEVIERAFEGVKAMRESVTYQKILAEGEEIGELKEARAILLRQGAKRFGPAPATARARVEAENTKERLEQYLDRVMEVESWDELME